MDRLLACYISTSIPQTKTPESFYQFTLSSLPPRRISPEHKMGQHTTLGWIWPKDPRPGNPTRWPKRWRLFDVLTNKGPDIYVGVINKKSPATKKKKEKAPRKTDWARWNGEQDADDTPFRWAKRDTSVKYDFRRRKYQVPDEGTWSRVEYCDGWRSGGRFGKVERHFVPKRYWDRNGDEYPACYWHDAVYGAHP